MDISGVLSGSLLAPVDVYVASSQIKSQPTKTLCSEGRAPNAGPTHQKYHRIARIIRNSPRTSVTDIHRKPRNNMVGLHTQSKIGPFCPPNVPAGGFKHFISGNCLFLPTRSTFRLHSSDKKHLNHPFREENHPGRQSMIQALLFYYLEIPAAPEPLKGNLWHSLWDAFVFFLFPWAAAEGIGSMWTGRGTRMPSSWHQTLIPHTAWMCIDPRSRGSKHGCHQQHQRHQRGMKRGLIQKQFDGSGPARCPRYAVSRNWVSPKCHGILENLESWIAAS